MTREQAKEILSDSFSVVVRESEGQSVDMDDAVSFFLEGYEYAQKEKEEKLDVELKEWS